MQRLAYASSVDALCQVLEGKEESCLGAHCWISDMSSKVKIAPNGLEYCSVHVKCSNGAEYTIPAFGKEASELMDEALRSAIQTPLVLAA